MAAPGHPVTSGRERRMKHSYYPPVPNGRLWRLADTLPGRKLLVALWAWM